jgi:hypothetical protein
MVSQKKTFLNPRRAELGSAAAANPASQHLHPAASIDIAAKWRHHSPMPLLFCGFSGSGLLVILRSRGRIRDCRTN